MDHLRKPQERAPSLEPQRSNPYVRYLPLVVLAIALAVFHVTGFSEYLTLDNFTRHRDTLKSLVQDYPVLSVLLYALIYATAAALSFPAVSVLTLFAGFLFGWHEGGLVSVLSATAGGTLLFLATKTALGGVLARKAGAYVQRFSAGFHDNAFAYMLILRLAPVFPFFVVNIVPGIIGIPVTVFVPATLLGILPATFAYAWLGSGFDKAIAEAEAAGREISLSDFVTPDITIAFALIATLALAAFLAQHFVLSRRNPKV